MSHFSWYKNDPTFRKFESGRKTYYVPVTEYVNAADNILVDTHNPNSAGFGGSTFRIATTEGMDNYVKGPWHGTVPYEVCNVSELHFTKVTILANAKRIPYDEWPDIIKKYGDAGHEWELRMTGDVVYKETEPVLGSFFRGDRIAQQLADLRKETLFVHVDSDGGSHSHECRPGGNLHPLAHRSGRNRHNDISAEQGGIVSA